MGESKIEWLRNPVIGKPGYSINPVLGLCPVDCKDNQGKSYCYARRLYARFKWNPEIRMAEDIFYQFYALKNKPPSRVFVGSTIELFGPWVKPEWMHSILSFCNAYKEHTFIFLTKNYQNLPEEWPDNCWVGVSTPNASDAIRASKSMALIKAQVKILSIEPMFDWGLSAEAIEGVISHYDLVIIGQRTPPSKRTAPKIEEIMMIVEAVDRAGIPVFQKNNLRTLLGDNLRQEYPKQA